MKTYLLLFILIFNIIKTDTSFCQFPEDQIEYFNSHLGELNDERNINILNTFGEDSIILTGETTLNQFGESVSNAGDVNGDGFSDIIVGAPGINKAYIFFGGEIMNNVADVVLTGESINDRFGNSVSTAGDVNGDGFSDIIVGAPNNAVGGPNAGRAYIYFGGIFMDNIADVVLTEAFGNGNFGSCVSNAGDYNHDGFDDVVVYKRAENTGVIYVYFGGLSMNNVTDGLLGTPSVISLKSTLDAGDINGDGFSDVIVGAKSANVNLGAAIIFFGGTTINSSQRLEVTSGLLDDGFGNSVSIAGDVNGDGYYDVIVGAWAYSNYKGRAFIFYGGINMDANPDLIMSGEFNGNRFGFSLSDAGDLNNDGFGDIIIGASTSIANRAYIFLGGSSMDSLPDKVINRDSLVGFGYSVSGVGDVNDDGFTDVIVGNYKFDSYTGRAYLYTHILPFPILINPAKNSINNSVSINFEWNKLLSAEYYILKISYDSLFNNIVVNDTLYIDTLKNVDGLLYDTKYFWKIISKDSSGIDYSSSIWSFSTIPPIYLNCKILFEGLYNNEFNLLRRKDLVTIYLHESIPPFNIVDSAFEIIDSLSFTGLFKFYNAPAGNYYLTIKHFNSIQTWSKEGGENLVTDGSIYNYDFTTSNTQAYGNNLKLKGSKYCLYSGDINNDGYINLTDLIPIKNDASNFTSGNFLVTDLTGDNIVDLTDVSLCYNNASNFVSVIKP